VEVEVERTFAHIYQEFGRIDVVVNNAAPNDPIDLGSRHDVRNMGASVRRPTLDNLPVLQALHFLCEEA
jgi:NAD(P)-dependent dehydrogenase (short-subunit alcohol dehydrogenase family)